MVAGRLRELMDGRHQVWDKRERRFREMRWSECGPAVARRPGPAPALFSGNSAGSTFPLWRSRVIFSTPWRRRI